jgi:hypothetical protein
MAVFDAYSCFAAVLLAGADKLNYKGVLLENGLPLV